MSSSLPPAATGSPATSGKPEMKRADKRSSITVLVLGDEAVGKSSLISTFVSRYFSEVVPGLMTRVRMPPDPTTGCVTTIVDSQQGDVALERLLLMNNNSSGGGGGGSGSQLLQQPQAAQQQQPTSPQRSSSTTATAGSPLASSYPAASTTMSMSQTSSASSSSSASMSSVQTVDSIVLVYDLDRPETFFRLENHWLPLIERTYAGNIPPVIVAENKVDLYRPNASSGGVAATTDEPALARKRQQIVSLMQRFPFIRQCIKVSAKNLLRLDDVFVKAQQAVLYPFTPPLYDLSTGQLSVECRRALARVFRMYDVDHDNILSDAELERFQLQTFAKPIFARDLTAWKKVVVRSYPTTECVVDNGFTVEGFYAIFDIFITQNRLDVIWEALRFFGYDDDLNLHIPESVTWGEEDVGGGGSAIGGSGVTTKSHGKGPSYWKLSSSAKHFLAAVFQQFDSDKDGILSTEDLIQIFSILPPPALPPWHPVRGKELFHGCFSVPKYLAAAAAGVAPTAATDLTPSMILPGAMSTTLPSQSGMSMLSSADSFPSTGDVDSSIILAAQGSDPQTASTSALKPLTFLEWMGYWHVLSAISPSVTREELFRMGHVEDYAGHKRKSKSHESRRRWKAKHQSQQLSSIAAGLPDAALRSREIRILILGSRGCGKTALLNYLRSDVASNTRTKTTIKPETSSTYVKLEKRHKHGDAEDIVVHLVFTDVPETAAASQETYYRQLTELFGSVTSPKDRVCDLAILVFDSTVASSLTYAKELESTLLTKETPRLFVGTKADRMTTEQVFDAAKAHCQEEDLEEQPLSTSAEDGGVKEREATLQHLARCALDEPGVDRLKSRPFEEQERREAERRRRMIWLGGIVSAGVVLVVGIGWLWGSSSSSKKESGSKGGGFAWLRQVFGRDLAEERSSSAELFASKPSNSVA